MSRELRESLQQCYSRLDKLTAKAAKLKSSADMGLNNQMWWETWDRINSITEALNQQREMRWTAKGDFSHLVPSGGYYVRG